MSKTKKKALIITTREEADDALKEIHTIELDLQYWDQREARAIQKVKDKYAALRAEGDVTGMQARSKALEQALHAWAKKAREKWGKESLDLQYGVLKFHAGQAAVKTMKKISKSFEVALDKLQCAEWGYDFIRTKKEINKEAILERHKNIAKMEAEKERFAGQLESVGLKVVQEESFTIKTTAEEEIRKRLEQRTKRLEARKS